MNLDNIKNQFPIFSKKINNKNLVYLDSSNSSQKPKMVIDRLKDFYSNEFSNVGRSVHTLAVAATNNYESTRVLVQKYLNAKHKDEIGGLSGKPIFLPTELPSITIPLIEYFKRFENPPELETKTFSPFSL